MQGQWLRDQGDGGDELRHTVAHEVGVPFVMLTRDDLTPEVLSLIPEPISRAHSVVALSSRGGVLEVALLDLSSLAALSFLEERGIHKILPRLTTQDSLQRALLFYQKFLKEKFGEELRRNTDPARTVDVLLSHAMLSHASDMHLVPREGQLLVRYRIGPRLYDAMTLPKQAESAFGRFKELANFSFTLPVPQEGKFKVMLESGESVSVRIFTLPTAAGESLRLRITPERLGKSGFTLESLGLHGEALEMLHKAISKRSGLILVGGPRGSGRTTLLYTLLDLVTHPGIQVATVEEEIEFRLPHVAQTRVQKEIGLTTAAALRATLKHDPDVVMVGNIADNETAALAVGAAARGILVLSGVEAPDAAGAVEKLKNLGITGEKLSAGLKAVVGLALVKRLCPHYKEEYKLSRIESGPFEAGADFGRTLAALKDEGVVGKETPWKEVLFARAAKCKECKDGYKGMVGLQEVLISTSNGFEKSLSLTEDALFKAVLGLTSLEQVPKT